MAAAAEPLAPAAQRPWDLGAVCEELIDHRLRLGSAINMSVVIVLFQKGLLAPARVAGCGGAREGEGAGRGGRMRWGTRARRTHGAKISLCIF